MRDRFFVRQEGVLRLTDAGVFVSAAVLLLAFGWIVSKVARR